MSEKKTYEVTRVSEVLSVKNGEAVWKEVPFYRLRKGDIFRLWDPMGDSRVPDHLVDGKHDVCVCLSDAAPTANENGVDTLVVKSLSVRGIG